MVSELVEFKGHLPFHAPSPKSTGVSGVYWEKSKSHIGYARLLIRVYIEEAILTLQASFAKMI